MDPSVAPPSPDPTPPPRAFTQGVGTVYQFTGVTLFLATMAICCGSGLMSMDTAKREDLARIGWHVFGQNRPLYSAQKGISVAATVAVGLGVSLAAVGLGLQGTRPHSAQGATLVSGIGTLFYLFHAIFFAVVLRSIGLTLVCAVLSLAFGGLLALAIGAWREMRLNPPPADLTILPPDYKVPYSHMHDEAPEVRYAAELEQRRRRLEVQQKEIEAMEARIRNNRYKRGESE